MNAFVAAALFSSSLNLNADQDDWFEVNDHELYSFSLPSYMYKVEDLNDEATHQYQYVDDPYYKGAKEIYMIVLPETKEEIASTGIYFNFNAKNYWQLSMEMLTEPLKAVKVLSPELQIEDFNGMKLTRSFVFAKFEGLKVYYNLAVYEGDHAFYQIVVWTVGKHFDYYKSDMIGIIESFQEK